MKRRLVEILIAIGIIVCGICLSGCGDDDTLFEAMGGKKVVYENMAIEVPESVAKASNVGVINNDCEMNEPYESNTNEHLLYTQMDTYYLDTFHVDREAFNPDNLANLLNSKAHVWVTSVESAGEETLASGVNKQLYNITAEVVPCRDLFADMKGQVSVLTYRNDVWISALLSVGDNELTTAIAKSIRVDDTNKARNAYSALDAAERDVPEKNAVKEIGKWGRISVMNKRVTGERTQILGRVEQVYDTSDSYGILQQYSESLAERKYTLPEGTTWTVAKIELFYGDIDRSAYDPYIDVRVKGENPQRTYVLAQEENTLYIFYETPKKTPYKLQVGDTKSLTVNVY